MAEASNELMYRTLQQIQDTLAEHTGRFDAINRRVEKLDRTIDDLTQPTSTAVGFAGYANLQHEQVDERMADLERQFGTIDELKRRVGHLEQAR